MNSCKNRGPRLKAGPSKEQRMTQQQQPAPPITPPVPQPESDFYWEKCKERELWLRRCVDCGNIYFYPRDICPACFSRNTDWMQSSGRGTVHTFCIVHRAPTPAFRDMVPLRSGDRGTGRKGPGSFPTWLDIEPDPEVIKCGMAVEVTFDDLTETISLPKFRPAG